MRSQTNILDTRVGSFENSEWNTIFEIDHEYIDILSVEHFMTALKDPTELHWKRRENDEKEVSESEHQVYWQLTDQLLWIDRADPGSVVESWTKECSGMLNVKVISRYRRDNHRVMTVELMQFSL